jgi:hypothetical protein
MKQFELQGDISSGFRWRVKGIGELELAEVKREAFVPLGDSSGSEGWARIQNSRKMRPPPGEEIAFDLSYDLLLASEREARRQLLAPWGLFHPAYAIEHIDPFVARELHLQEKRDKELRDVLDALFGTDRDWCVGLCSKAGAWRIGLCIEARRNDYARDELARAMNSAANRGDTREVARFLEAFRAVDRLKERGPVKIGKALALFFVLGCRVRGEPLPTRSEVLRIVQSRLASGDIDSLKRNASRDIFTGPILSALLRGRAGRPLKTRRSRGK